MEDKFKKIIDLISKYKEHIKRNGLKDEIYKWELLAKYNGRPDLNSENFFEEFKSIDFRNLIYHNGKSAAYHLAKERGDLYKNCFKVLFDESKMLIERIKYFRNETLKLYRELVPNEKLSHHHDERTIATFLTFHNPNQYTLYKDTFYQKYCKLLEIQSKAVGEKYVHYLVLIEAFIQDYIIKDSELINLINANLNKDCFEDSTHKLLAQDILYQMLEKKTATTGRDYWRIGTSDGGDNNFWDYMLKNNVACIGWSEIGDLNVAAIENKTEIETLLKNAGYYQGDNRTLSRKAGEIYNFYNDLTQGDIVLALDGLGVLGIVVVTEEYYYSEVYGFDHLAEVYWQIKSPGLSN